MKIYISDELRRVLESLENHSIVAYRLLNDKTDSDSNYLDISHSDPFRISYITKDRILKIKEEYPDKDNDEVKKIIWKKKRYLTRPGKIVKKIFSDIPDKEIEIFSSYYKGIIEKNNTRIEIVKGNKIKKYFHYSYYEQMSGTIAQSCMRYDESQSLLDFYTKNTNISMLVVFSKVDPDRITGRALLWQTQEGYKIMDRIYDVDPHYEYIFRDWAKQNGYYTKKKNNWYNTTNFISPDGKNIELKLSVKINNSTMKYPYLDTFKWLDSDKNINL